MKKSLNPNSKKQKKSGSYNLIKGSMKQLNSYCNLYQIMKRDTKQIWQAKIFDNKQISNLKLSQYLEYNEQVLLNCNDMENILHVQQIFTKGGKTFIIQQQIDTTLTQKVAVQFPLSCGLIQDILCDVINGLTEIYSEKYVTRNLRPEHIVCVDEVWKIQSFVLDSKIFNIESEFCWSSKFASPEDRHNQNLLPQKQIDQQLVWNLGIIGLFALLGNQFDYENINSDTFIPWAKIKQLSSQALYDFLVSALKINFKERLRLKDLISNPMFAHISNFGVFPFNSYQKYYGNESEILDQQKQKVVVRNEQDENNIQAFKQEIQRFNYFGEVQKYVQQLHFKNSYDINLIRYLCFKIAYQNLSKIRNELQLWKKNNWLLNNNRQIQQLQKDLGIRLQRFQTYKEKYGKNLRGLQITKSEVPEIRNGLQQQVSDDSTPYYQLIHIFMKMAGCIYTEVSKLCEIVEDDRKKRTVCFYSLAAYLIHFYKINDFASLSPNSYIQNGVLSLTNLINDAPILQLIELTQKLIKNQFATIEAK